MLFAIADASSTLARLPKDCKHRLLRTKGLLGGWPEIRRFPGSAEAADKTKEPVVHCLLLIPPTLSFLLLAAHELRTGDPLHLAGWAAAALLLLTLPRAWVRSLCLLALCLGLLVWAHRTMALLRFRILVDEPYALLLAIMGSVACLMIVSILILFSKPMQTWFEDRKRHPGNTE
jgi:hypothetical protein